MNDRKMNDDDVNSPPWPETNEVLPDPTEEQCLDTLRQALASVSSLRAEDLDAVVFGGLLKGGGEVVASIAGEAGNIETLLRSMLVENLRATARIAKLEQGEMDHDRPN